MSEPDPGKIRATNFYHSQEQRLNEEFSKHFFGERAGGPMRFESTPREGPNPFYERFFVPKTPEE